MKGAVSSQGQVTIPKAIREAAGIKAGDRLTFEVRGGEVIVRKADSGIDWDQVHRIAGAVDFGGKSSDEVMAEIRPTFRPMGK